MRILQVISVLTHMMRMGRASFHSHHTTQERQQPSYMV